MKTQIIQLDAHDDLVSIRDRMAWAKSPRILLVWPRRGRVGIRPLDLTLLRRHAEDLGAELGLVTKAGDIRAVAREEGISYFATTAQAQKKAWREKRPARPVRRFARVDLQEGRKNLPRAELFGFTAHPIWRVLVFGCGVLAVLAVMLVFIPSAEIQVIPPIRQQSLIVAVSADPDASEVSLSGVVPQRPLKIVIEGSDSALASGSTLQPDQAATGQVLLMNLTEKAVSVPAGTILVAPANQEPGFETVADVQVPAGKGKSISAAVKARKPGKNGNLPPGSITSFEGPLALSLAVTNPGPTSGGSENQLPLPTDNDREQLRKRLLADLEQRARDQFVTLVSTGDVLLPASLEVSRVIEETTTPPSGQPGKKITTALKVEFRMTYAASSDLLVLAKKVLDTSLEQGSTAMQDSIAIQALSMPSVGPQGNPAWEMRVTRDVRPYIDPGQVISLSIGKRLQPAGQAISQAFGLTQPPSISVHPSWWPWLPFLPVRITVSG